MTFKMGKGTMTVLAKFDEDLFSYSKVDRALHRHTDSMENA
jgi:hypothetical protein